MPKLTKKQSVPDRRSYGLTLIIENFAFKNIKSRVDRLKKSRERGKIERHKKHDCYEAYYITIKEEP